MNNANMINQYSGIQYENTCTASGNKILLHSTFINGVVDGTIPQKKI